jgi:hypothetical protein
LTTKKPEKAEVAKIKIDKNVPVPAHRHAQSMYPFAELDVGDSFHAPDKAIKNFYPVVTKWKKKLQRNFIVRAEGKGVRVWRIEGSPPAPDASE